MSRIVATSLVVSILGAGALGAQAGTPRERASWRSPLADLVYLQIERELAHPELDAEDQLELPARDRIQPLPEAIEGALGPYQVDYESRRVGRTSRSTSRRAGERSESRLTTCRSPRSGTRSTPTT